MSIQLLSSALCWNNLIESFNPKTLPMKTSISSFLKHSISISSYEIDLWKSFAFHILRIIHLPRGEIVSLCIWIIHKKESLLNRLNSGNTHLKSMLHKKYSFLIFSRHVKRQVLKRNVFLKIRLKGCFKFPLKRWKIIWQFQIRGTKDVTLLVGHRVNTDELSWKKFIT